MILPSCSESVNKMLEFMKLLINKGLNTLTSGNLSSKCTVNNKILLAITPSGMNKYYLTNNDIVFYDFEKQMFYGKNRPTTEYKMHVKVYEVNDLVNAIAHAHNPLTLSIVDAEVDIDAKYKVVEKVFNMSSLVESKYVVGKTCVTKYIEPGTRELAEIVASLSKSCDNVILSQHGVVSFGKTLEQSVERLIGLEYISLYYLSMNILNINKTFLNNILKFKNIVK